MARRSEHKISQSFYDGLFQVNNFTFSEVTPSLDPTGSDASFLMAIPHICNILKIQLPSLLNARDGKIYTEDTCQEYHQLLVILLKRFRKSLQQFALSNKECQGSWKEEFKDYLEDVVLWGELLQLMIDGQAIEQHLRVITCELVKSGHPGLSRSEIVVESQLSEDTAVGEGADSEGVDAAVGEDAALDKAGDTDSDMNEDDVDLSGVQMEEDAEDEMGNTEMFAKEDSDDADFAGMQRSTNRVNRGPVLIWESYRDWLKLLTVHFEAIKIITSFIAAPYPTTRSSLTAGRSRPISPDISISVLAPGHQGYTMLGWEAALREFLPGPKKSRAPKADANTIIDFIKEKTLADSAEKENILKEVEESLRELNTGKVVCSTSPGSQPTRRISRPPYLKLLQSLRKFATDNRPINDEKIDAVIKSITLLKHQYKATAVIDVAVGKMESLKIRSPFTPFKEGTNLSIGVFSGTIHCELCLATLVHLADRDKSADDTLAPRDFLENFKVIIISSTAYILLMLY